MAVQELRAVTITPPGLRVLGAGFQAGGQFIVRARFDEEDAFRYEYRQYIKGTAILTRRTAQQSRVKNGTGNT